MGIAWNTWRHRKTLVPLRKKTRFEEMIGGLDAVDSRQTHFLHQAVLQRFKQPLDAPLGLGALGRDPFDPQFAEGPSELSAGSLALQLFANRGAAGRAEDAVFIGVMGQRTSMALQPSPQSSQVLFGGVVLGKTSPDAAGGVIDQSDQLTGRTALLQPTEGRAILHHQLSKTGSSLSPHMDLFHSLAARAPQGRLGHPLPQRLSAHRQAIFG